jgi:DNA polymerase-1
MNKFSSILKNFRKFYSVKAAVKENLAFKEKINIPSVTIVRDKAHAQRVVDILTKMDNRFHAWDTETLDIDPKEQSPVGNGRIMCFSCFAGPDIDFGNGPRLFIDNYAECEGIVDVFKDYFEDKRFLKVWHNYSFDRHIFYNHGINVLGFGGDTLHMARLYDTSRMPNEFSLSKLTEIYHDDLLKVREYYLKYFRKQHPEKESFFDNYENYNDKALKKIDMKTLFSYKKILRTGDEGKTIIMPELQELHTTPKYIKDWIKYSVIDAEATYYLRDALQIRLQSLSTKTLSHKNPINKELKNNFDIYMKYWRPFGELMTDMERVGIYIDTKYLKVVFVNLEYSRKS